MKYYINKQKEFQKHFFKLDSMTDVEKKKWMKEFALNVMVELSELIIELKDKHHRNNEETIDSNITEEWIDTFKYLINIALLLDLDEKKIKTLFDNKTLVVEQRYEQEIKLKNMKDAKKVIVVDIDDVLCDYNKFFTSKFNDAYGTDCDSVFVIKEEHPKEYIDFKHHYRVTGYKREVPVIKNAKSMCSYFHKLGYKILLISSRPYKKYFRIFSDTLYWLKKNNIAFDALYFDENKYEKIMKEFPQTNFFIDDMRNNANSVGEMGFKVFLLNKQWNKGEINKNVTRINDLQDIIKMYEGGKLNGTRRNKKCIESKKSRVSRS